jgi:hypothetical protein
MVQPSWRRGRKTVLSPSGETVRTLDWPLLALFAQARRRRLDPVAHRFLGRVRRKPGAGRRTLAYFAPGSILPVHGDCVDHPLETIDQVDGNGTLESSTRSAELNLLY